MAKHTHNWINEKIRATRGTTIEAKHDPRHDGMNDFIRSLAGKKTKAKKEDK